MILSSLFNLLFNINENMEPWFLIDETVKSPFIAIESYLLIVRPSPHPSLLSPLGLSTL
jgi:hypothetical protein